MLRVTGQGSEIEITDVMGDANVTGEFYGPIRVRNVAKNTHYSSQKAEIQVVKLTGLLELDSGSIEVSDVAGAAKLTTSEKDIDVENVAGKLTIAITTHREGGLRRAAARRHQHRKHFGPRGSDVAVEIHI